MRTNAFVKIAMLAFLGILSSSITSSICANQLRIAAQNGSTKKVLASQFQDVRPSSTIAARKSLNLRPSVDPSYLPKKGYTAMHVMRGAAIQVVNERVLIAASAYLYDKRIEKSYIWSVKVNDSAGEEVSRFAYFDQEFFLPSELETDSFILEEFDLLPGNYSVQLAISEVSFGQDPATIGFISQNVLLSRVEQITIK